jgi:hypothetical protein
VRTLENWDQLLILENRWLQVRTMRHFGNPIRRGQGVFERGKAMNLVLGFQLWSKRSGRSFIISSLQSLEEAGYKVRSKENAVG